MRAFVVVDLGFGDAGKGLLTDFLVRRTGATVVVRYNGGAQAGHNVVTADGRHHTFAQLGSGTFVPGVRTFLSRDVVIHPAALLTEARALAAQGVADALARLAVSEQALVITPFHQAANRLREIARGPARHGSCGVGVGETVRHAAGAPAEAIHAADLREPALLRDRLHRIRARLASEMLPLSSDDPRAALERRVFAEDDVLEAWITQAQRLAELDVLAPDEALRSWLAEAPAVVFEGAQGVLLDETHGFHPYTTWSNCTVANARRLLDESAPDAEVETIGILRSHAVRHGPGPLPTETDGLREAVAEHNCGGEWQGEVRYGWFDAALARYAIDVVGGIDTLAVTHLDAPSRLGRWRTCRGYHLTEPAETVAHPHVFTTAPSLDARKRLTQRLLHAVPMLEDCDPTEPAVRRQIENLLGRAVDLVSRGPTAGDVGD